MTRALLGFLPSGDSPLMLHAAPDLRILGFNAGLAILTGLLFGLAPALHAMRLDLWSTLKDAVGAVTGSGGSVRLRKCLVIAQVAFSFLLLAGAGLFVRTLANLKQTNSGFREVDNLITFQVDPALNGYSLLRLKAFYKQALENIRTLPGVKLAGYAAVPVLSGGEWDSTMSVQGHQSRDGEDMQAFMNAISPGYFQTLGVPLLEGREFDSRRGEPQILHSFLRQQKPDWQARGVRRWAQIQARYRNRGRDRRFPIRRSSDRRAPPGFCAACRERFSNVGGFLRSNFGRFRHHVRRGTPENPGPRPVHADLRDEDAGRAA
jgi:hypothetical protein